MHRRLRAAGAALLANVSFQSQAFSQPMEGSINRFGWRFSWHVDSTSGLRIRSLHRNGVSYLYNGSLPAIRVQYDSSCGPYLDRIKWDNIVADGSGQKVRINETANWLRVWVQAQIASYALTQSWWFHRTQGLMVPEVASSGLQCEINHRHHPYWRFDFDVQSAGNNRVQTFKSGVYTNQNFEFNMTKAIAGNDVIIFPSTDLTAFANLKPGGNDGTPDGFAGWDYAGRRYPSLQNDPWAPWSTSFADQGDLEAVGNPNTSNNGESINIADVVLWYNGHLSHAASAGPTQWAYVGPWVYLIDN